MGRSGSGADDRYSDAGVFRDRVCSATGSQLFAFFATGYAAFYMYRSTADQICAAVEANRVLLNYPVVSPYDNIIARELLRLATLFIVNVMLFGSLDLFCAI